MSKINADIILGESAKLFAYGGLGMFRIRKLADRIGVAPSVIYHYFRDEKVLLREMFTFTNTQLGKKRAALPEMKTTEMLLKQRIAFQFDNAEAIVAVLKYYFAFRSEFDRSKDGYLPDKSSLHMEEVLTFAKSIGDYGGMHLKEDAKVMTHAVNGYLLEYFPHNVDSSEKKRLVSAISRFLMQAINNSKKFN